MKSGSPLLKHYQEEIEAPAGTVWELIRDFADVSAWTPSTVVRTEGAGIGMIRHVENRAGYVTEQCEAHDDTMMMFSYRLLESPWSFTNYVATVRLTEARPDKTTIEWSSTFETEPDEGEETRATIESTYRTRFIANLRESAVRKIQGDQA